jgi:hypothetical protein
MTAAAALVAVMGFSGTAKADPYADFLAGSFINEATCAGGCYGDATLTLEAPGGGFASLGHGGWVLLNFTDNICFVGTGDDIIVYERGPANPTPDPDDYDVQVGLINGSLSTAVSRSTFLSGPNPENLDSTGVTVFNQLKITDTGNAGGGIYAGTDVDAVECLDSFDFGTAHIVKSITEGGTNINITSKTGFNDPQEYQFTITITNSNGVNLSYIIFKDVVPAEFDVTNAEVTADPDLDGANQRCDVDSFEHTNNGNGPAKLQPDIIEITADTLAGGESCTITVDVATDNDHPGKNSLWTPTSCPIGGILLNEGVQVWDDVNEDWEINKDDDTLLFVDDDTLTLGCVPLVEEED